jgi:hypothetical protein
VEKRDREKESERENAQRCRQRWQFSIVCILSIASDTHAMSSRTYFNYYRRRQHAQGYRQEGKRENEVKEARGQLCFCLFHSLTFSFVVLLEILLVKILSIANFSLSCSSFPISIRSLTSTKSAFG